MFKTTENKSIEYSSETYNNKEVLLLELLSEYYKNKDKYDIEETIKKIILKTFTEKEEKTLLTKISKDKNFYILEDDLYPSTIFKTFAREEVKSDKKYLSTLLKNDSYYLSDMPEKIKKDKVLVQNLINGLTTEEEVAITYSCMDEKLQKDPEMGITYISKLKKLNRGNKQFTKKITKEVFRLSEKSDLSQTEEVVSSWLKDKSFISSLIDIDTNFIGPLENGDIKYCSLNDRYPLDWIEMSLEARKLCDDEGYEILSDLLKRNPQKTGDVTKKEFEDIKRIYAFHDSVEEIIKEKTK